MINLSSANKVPVAFIRANTQNINGKTVTNGSHYNPDRAPASVKICIGAKVMLTGWNACPEWGLFHGAIGTVHDIVFDDGDSPNHYKLPLYVLCNFQQYCGPPFIPSQPKVIPIPTIQIQCDKIGCRCQRKYVPLTLAFAKTIHTFQGANVGPTYPGQPPNEVSRVIVFPGP